VLQADIVVSRNWAKIALCFAVSLLAMGLPLTVFAYTIAELTRAPASFNEQEVKVIGEVANVVTRYGETLYTTFDLLDEHDIPLPVFIWGKPTFKQGDICRVTGKFAMEETLGTHVLARGVEAEKVEKLSDAEDKTVVSIFSKKKKYGGLRGANGIYIPTE
jgi:hypothetical protein